MALTESINFYTSKICKLSFYVQWCHFSIRFDQSLERKWTLMMWNSFPATHTPVWDHSRSSHSKLSCKTCVEHRISYVHFNIVASYTHTSFSSFGKMVTYLYFINGWWNSNWFHYFLRKDLLATRPSKYINYIVLIMIMLCWRLVMIIARGLLSRKAKFISKNG